LAKEEKTVEAIPREITVDERHFTFYEGKYVCELMGSKLLGKV
jgi:hypothetical protein